MIKNVKGMALVLLLLGISTGVQAEADITRENFLMVTSHMMAMPCTVPEYMQCLGKKQNQCQKAVDSSIANCKKNVNIPASIPRKDISVVMGKYGACMTEQLKQNLKLEMAKLKKCESILSEHAKKIQKKK